MAIVVVLVLAHPVEAQTGPFGDSEHGEDHVGVKLALQDSLRFLTMQHVLRIGIQDKTRRELSGHFFADYQRSVRAPRQWADGDSVLTNYVGHPVQGAATGYIWLQRDLSAPLAFSLDRAYFSSRAKGMAWAAGYSAQFELGLLSEASIGNVGLRPETAGWVDHVMTPAGGLALMIGEDALDRFVVKTLERRVRSPIVRATARLLLNPARSTANVAALRAPWYRPDRPLRHSQSPPPPLSAIHPR